MLELAIVRHGESVRNFAADLARHGDTSWLEYQLRFERDELVWDLTQRGIDQAKVAGVWIRENIASEFEACYVSPFKRTLQTSACLGLANARWVVDNRIRERDWGDYSAPGQPLYTVDQYLEDLSECNGVAWKRPFPGAESIADMVPRCLSFMVDLFKSQQSGRVILVTHGGTMKTLQLVIERLTIEEAGKLAERHLTNCSVLQYRLADFVQEEACWVGQVRFASPATPGAPVSDWQHIAGC